MAGTQREFASYGEFVTELLALVEPMLNPEFDPKVGFSGAAECWRYDSDPILRTALSGWEGSVKYTPDSSGAVLRGDRALFLEAMGKKSAIVTQVSPELYKASLGKKGIAYLLPHSAYARNIRRWMSGGTVPRRKARSDLILVATCWLLGWGDERAASSEDAVLARETILSWNSREEARSEAAELAIIESLWKASTQACEASRSGRKPSGSTHQ